MKKTANRAAVVYVLIGAFLCGVIFMTAEFVIHGADWASSKANLHIYSNGTVVNAGTIYD